MENIIKSLKTKLAPLIDSQVKQILLIIWPDEEGAKRSDVQMNMTLEKDDETISLTFAIDGDGQTPVVSNQNITWGYPLSKLSERETLWAKSEYWNIDNELTQEIFLVDPNSEFGDFLGKKIQGINILYFQNDIMIPAGIEIEFSKESSIYCVPGLTRGMILKFIPEGYFPDTVFKIKV